MAITVRRDATSLTAAEKANFIAAVQQLKANGTYDKYVLRHHHAAMAGGIHSRPAFLPWHRMFILEYERDLQNVSGNPDLFLPYWDWTSDATLANSASSSVWGIDFMGGNGDPNDGNIVKTGPFRQGSWEIVDEYNNPAGPLLRSFGIDAPYLPERKNVVKAMKKKRYDRKDWDRFSPRSFRNWLEGWLPNPPELHNLVHVWVGGSMEPMTSPNDPIFFLHHCFVDKIWHDWQERYPSQNYRPTGQGPTGQNQNDQMEPTVYGTSRPADTPDIEALGYIYDNTDRWDKPGCTWITRMETQCTRWAVVTRKQCDQTADQGYLQCAQQADQGYLQCAQQADQGYNQCSEQQDQGYNNCCTWWPCSWGCQALVWIQNLVCVAWTWIHNIVCVAWTWIHNIVCVAWTWVSHVVCVAWTYFVSFVCTAFAWIMRRILFCG